MQPREFQAILFDLDCTLIASEHHGINSFRETSQAFGSVITDDHEGQLAAAYHNGYLPLQDWVRQFTEDQGHDHEKFRDHYHRLFNEGLPTVRLLEGVAETVPDLARRYPLGIVTDSRFNRTRIALDGRLLHHFDVIVDNERGTNYKPDPYGYLEGARLLGVPASKCLAVEDSPEGVSAAKAAGMSVIGVSNGHVLSHDLRHADWVIKDISQLRRVLDLDAHDKPVARWQDTWGDTKYEIETFRSLRLPDRDHVVTAFVLAYDNNGSLLLANHVKRGWDPTGGHRNDREGVLETPEQTARRELLEEANATVGPLTLLGYDTVRPADGDSTEYGIQAFYAAPLLTLDARAADDEIREARLFTPREAKQVKWVVEHPAIYKAGLEAVANRQLDLSL